jgi:hypothetical protein
MFLVSYGSGRELGEKMAVNGRQIEIGSWARAFDQGGVEARPRGAPLIRRRDPPRSRFDEHRNILCCRPTLKAIPLSGKPTGVFARRRSLLRRRPCGMIAPQNDRSQAMRLANGRGVS